MMKIPENFDEEYYLMMNPDVETAVLDGKFKSAKEHYELFGFKENSSLKLKLISLQFIK